MKIRIQHQLAVVVLICGLSGCATSRSITTGPQQITFGMSKEDVLKRVEKTDKVISVGGDEIVSEGTLPDKSVRIKTFTFKKERLISIEFKPVPQQPTDKSLTPESTSTK